MFEAVHFELFVLYKRIKEIRQKSQQKIMINLSIASY